jgi:enoyl-CoA hydratase
VPYAQLMDEALAVALTIAGHGQVAVIAAKESVNRAFESSLGEGISSERQAFYALFATQDQKEGMQAFLEKRPAVFKNC